MWFFWTTAFISHCFAFISEALCNVFLTLHELHDVLLSCFFFLSCFIFMFCFPGPQKQAQV